MRNIFIFLAAAWISIFGQTRTLTLEESIKLGLENSKSLKISASKVLGSDAKVTETLSQMLPKMSLGAGYTRLSDVPPFLVSVPIFPLPIKIQDAILNNYNFRLTLQQPLFTGFRLSSLKSAAEYNREAFKSDFNKDMNDAALSIHVAFWNYYKAQKILALVEENLKQLEQHLNDTKNFLENGLATRDDFLKIEVQYSNVKLSEIESANNVKMAQAAFNKTIGLNLTEKTDIVSSEIPVNVGEVKFEDLVKEAVDRREELISTQLRIKAGEETVSAARSNWFPSLFLVGDYYYNRPNQRIMPAKDEFDNTWDVGVSLTWDLWNWGYNSSQTIQAEQLLVQSKTSLQQIKDNIELELYQNYLDLIGEYEKVDVNKKSVEQAQENYKITSAKYNQQTATSTDLIDADISLLDAKTRLANSLVDFQLAKVKLEKAAGRRIY